MCFAPTNITNGLSFEPSPLTARQTDALIFSRPVVSRGTSFQLVLPTVVDETILFQTEVSVAKIEHLRN